MPNKTSGHHHHHNYQLFRAGRRRSVLPPSSQLSLVACLNHPPRVQPSTDQCCLVACYQCQLCHLLPHTISRTARMVELKCGNILKPDISMKYIYGVTLGSWEQLRPKGRVLSSNYSWNERQDKQQYILFYFNVIYLCFSSSLSPDDNTQRGHNHRGRTPPHSCHTPDQTLF